MKRFLRNLVESLRSPSFYERIAREGKFSHAFGHFSVFLFLLSLLVSVGPMVKYSRLLADDATFGTVRSAVLDAYPDELELRLRDGIVSSNVVEPYRIPVPGELLGEDAGDADVVPAMIAIDTARPISTETFRELDAFIVIGRTDIAFREEDGTVTIRALGDTFGDGDFTVNEAVLTDRFDRTAAIVRPATRIGVFFLPVILFLTILPTYLIYLLFGALLVLVVANANGFSYGYAQAYRAGLYLLTVPVTYGILTSVWLFPGLRFPFLATILLVIMTAGLIRKTPNEKREASSEPVTDGTSEKSER